MEKEEIKKIADYLQNNAKAFVYYYDNGCFEIYKTKKDWEKDKKPVFDLDDGMGSRGYISLWADIVAELCKIEIDSV